MMLLRIRLTLAIVCILLTQASSLLYGRDLDGPLLKSYDYIICGCGISGLVVANRLSELPGINVLCVEAGQADHYEAIVQDPVYIGADIGGVYDWDLSTVPQKQLDGAARPMPQGKALGGGSILNAMCWNRGGQDDYNAWETLGNPGWGWAGLLPYFQKSETYTPVYSQQIAHDYSIDYNPAVHGFNGPVQVSYPKFFYPQSINLFAALNSLGVPTQFDQAEGLTAGAALVPADIDPNNQTRSDARRAYYDPFATRTNLHVITGQHVTRILIDGISGDQATGNPTTGGNTNGQGPDSGNTGNFGFGPAGGPPPPPPGTNPNRRFVPRGSRGSNLRITGIEFSPNASAPRQTIYATREVIVAAGSLHSTQLLELSGIGPAALLQQLNITVALDLPGVGNNLQDHCLVGTFYPYNNASFPSPADLTTNATYNSMAQQEYQTNKTGPWTAGAPNALAFPSLPSITNNTAVILINATSQGPADFLLPGLDSTIVAGFAAQKSSVVQRLGTTTSAAYEIINNNAGSLTLAVMHPLSRGVCYINSPDPFEPPLIDPRWLTNPVDRQILIEALRFNRRILATPEMFPLQPAQFVPPRDADEAALNQVINNGIRTEFHPSGTLAMLPLNMGGVVDPHLRVYGTQNLRVVDASIFPMVPAAHLQAVVYAVAEKAADIIKADNTVVQPSPIPNTTVTATPSTRAPIVVPVNPSTLGSGASEANTAMSAFTTQVTSVAQPTTTSLLMTTATITTDSSPFVTSLSSTTSTVSSNSSLWSPQVSTFGLGSLVSSGSTSITLSLTSISTLSSTLPGTDVELGTASIAITSSSVLTEVLTSNLLITTPTQTLSDTESSQSTANLSVISSSIVAVLTSIGVPAAEASSLEPAVAASLGGPNPTTTTLPMVGAPPTSGPQTEHAALLTFIQWLLHFFHLD